MNIFQEVTVHIIFMKIQKKNPQSQSIVDSHNRSEGEPLAHCLRISFYTCNYRVRCLVK